jgi:integrase
VKTLLTDEKLLGMKPCKVTDAACRGLRAVVTETSVRWEVRHPDGKGEWIGEFVRPVPRPGDPAFIRHMPIKDARIRAETLRSSSARTADIITFRSDMLTYLDAQTWKPVPRGTTARKSWLARMTLHCEAILERPTAALTTEEIAQVLQTVLRRREIIRKGKPCDMIPTARFVRGMITAIIEKAMHGPTKGRWPKGCAHPCVGLKYHVNIPPLKKRRQKGHAAMALFTDEHGPGVQDFYERLVRHPRRTRTARAICWLLLTLCPRVKEVRMATWGQMHLDRADPEWHIPDPIMKVSKDRPNGVRIVPLSRMAVAFLWSFRPDNPLPSDPVFPGLKGGPLSENAMRALMRIWEITDATLHGFRRVLTEWCAENHPHLNEACEVALDHEVTLSKSRPDYHTALLLKPRRELAERWGAFVTARVPLVMPQLHLVQSNHTY